MYKEKFLERWANRKNYDKSIDVKSSEKRVKILYLLIAFSIGLFFSIPVIAFSNFFEHLPLVEKYAILLPIIGFFSGVELYIMYKLSFRVVKYLIEKYDVDLDDENYISSFKSVATRVALEMREPHVDIFNIDSRKNLSRKKEFFVKILYKLKIVLTNTVVKIILRRVVVSNSFRVYVEYISAVVIGIWHSIIAYIIFSKMINLVQGNRDIKTYFETEKDTILSLSKNGKVHLFQIVGNRIVEKKYNHPNLQFIAFKLHNLTNCKEIENHALDDNEAYFKIEEKLSSEEKEFTKNFKKLVETYS